MTPRIAITSLPETATLGTVLAVAADSKCSRIPVYREDVDHIVGVIFAKDLLDFVRLPDDLDGTRLKPFPSLCYRVSLEFS
jgi:putative hemolysin